MNIKDLTYIIKIAEERNLTHAAEKLYLTPSALNQHILQLERQLKQPLFVRDRHGWEPTEAGRIYLAGAREILHIKQNTYRRLNDLYNADTGTLTIGLPPERGGAVFNYIYREFHQRYPRLTLKLVETSVKNQHRLLWQGQLDMGFVTLQASQEENFTYQTICNEEFVVVVPKTYSTLLDQPNLTWEALTDLNKDLPMAMISPNSTLYECLTALFQLHHFTPTILLEAARVHTLVEAAAAGFCFAIVPRSNVLALPPQVMAFTLADAPCWQIKAVYPKKAYLSKAAQAFISLSTTYWQKLLQP